jgi:FlaA1/EpsC-like NDP-sugar epimerase
MITGGGGSMGSELARRAAQFDPAGLIQLDRSESDLFRIDSELARSVPHVDRIRPRHGRAGAGARPGAS